MTGLDTNVLVRFFAQDDPLQSPMADEVIGALTPREPGWVSVAAVLELIWVMTSTFRVSRGGIIKILNLLFTREEIVIERADLVEVAFRRYRNGHADFADYFIAVAGRAAGCTRSLTFDRIGARDAGMELIG
jgi:predicted nucleic-acid-binding protein